MGKNANLENSKIVLNTKMIEATIQVNLSEILLSF